MSDPGTGDPPARAPEPTMKRYRVHVQPVDPSDPASGIEYVACPADPSGEWVKWSDAKDLLTACMAVIGHGYAEDPSPLASQDFVSKRAIKLVRKALLNAVDGKR